MKVVVEITNLDYLKGFQIDEELIDDDYNYILWEYHMNFSLESLRNGYQELKEKKNSQVTDDILLELGYGDSDILNRKE